MPTVSRSKRRSNLAPRQDARLPPAVAQRGTLADPDRVPDVRSKAFAREAHRQSLAVANSRHAKKDQDFIDAISAWDAE